MDKRLQRLRAADRISAPTIIQALLPTMTQQRGDRLLGQDAALTAGFGRTATGRQLAVLGVESTLGQALVNYGIGRSAHG
ncbi:hypothetical protein WP50_16135 [Lactiplantibacillus plantarum]|nr:hypothetical protein WP50_16135 [Lactiplantibacillus plantarum]